MTWLEQWDTPEKYEGLQFGHAQRAWDDGSTV